MSLGDSVDFSPRKRWVTTLASGLAVLAALYLTAGLLIFLPTSSFVSARVAFFVVVAALSWAGAVAILLGRPPGAILASVALVLLGFWQAVLWIFMLPAALSLAVAGLIIAHAPG